jgi:hypothetical protein
MKFLVTVIALLMSHSALAKTTGYSECDEVIQKTAAAAYGIEEAASSTISITSAKVTKVVEKGMGNNVYIKAKFASVDLGVEGTAKVVRTNGGCFLQSLTTTTYP